MPGKCCPCSMETSAKVFLFWLTVKRRTTTIRQKVPVLQLFRFFNDFICKIEWGVYFIIELL